MSVHPYRADALQQLEHWAGKGVRLIKWLPNAMGIDPADPKCLPYYRKMKELNLVLLTHAGEEKAVEAEEEQKYGNPLRLRAALNEGVKVIIAHCASLGENADLDNGDVMKPNFDLFLRLMDEKKYEHLLFADISALTQDNRSGLPLKTMLNRTDLHHRLVNGSDYPLPAINIIIHTKRLVNAGYITRKEAKYLKEIYDYNPLLFDFVLKRTLHGPGAFPAAVFMKNEALGL
jgi:predicted TIM-barrel fold metal-dependent hydrolase